MRPIAHRRFSAIRAGLSALTLLAAVAAATEARAQQCPPVPVGFRPHIAIYPRATLLESPRFTLAVLRLFVHCTTSRTIPVFRHDDLRFEIVTASGSTISLPWRSLGERDVVVTLPRAGDFELLVTSPSAPQLEAARVRIRVIDARSTVRFDVRLTPPPGREPTRAAAGGLVLGVDGYDTRVFAVRWSGGFAAGPLRLPSATYSLRWRSPRPVDLTSTVTVTRDASYEAHFEPTPPRASDPPSSAAPATH